MNRSGVVDLPLHGGSAPYWLVKRMKGLAYAMFGLIVDEHGVDGLIKKLADPLWFQSLSCVLAYDWHSSGTTTVVCGVLKSVIVPEEFGIGIAGGKGKTSKNTLSDIDTIGDKMGFSDSKISELKYASRISAKVDNACVQDGYQLYHHSMIISEKGEWAVIQQGMNPRNQFARRYHWLSSAVKRYEEEPHKGIVGVRQEEEVLDLTSKTSRGCKETSLDLVNASTGELERLYKELGGGKKIKAGQRTLFNFEDATKDAVNEDYEKSKVYKLPKRVNWDAFRVAYDKQPANYEQLLGIRGVGPAAVRALSLISELIYGERPSWRDPVKYSFAFGGKDGVPYPVDRRAMDETTVILREVMKEAREKVKTIC